MRDCLFVLIYLAMVLTPAVVAMRSGRETGRDERASGPNFFSGPR